MDDEQGGLIALDHVNIKTARLDQLVAFYCGVLGLDHGRRPPFPFAGAWLYCGQRPVVHLVETPPSTRPTQDPDSVGLDRSVSVGPPPTPGISLGLSTATITAPPSGIRRCNSAGALAGDESAARIPSADSAVHAAGVPNASAGRPLDFRDDL